MKDVTFDGYAEPGSDLGAAWRAKLAREGKLEHVGRAPRDWSSVRARGLTDSTPRLLAVKP